MSDQHSPLLDVRELTTRFDTAERVVRAVDGVSFTVAPGETVGLVGESGCGKTVTALSLMRLVPEPSGRIVAGAVRFEGQDLLALDGESMRRVRGNRMAMIFQDPLSSLNPVLTIGRQVEEGIRTHLRLDRRAARRRALELFDLVGIADAPARLEQYPHQLSGGMRQRVLIAMALACSPRLVIADEPTTALDVTIQAQILDLLAGLSRELGTAFLLITHDLGVVAGMTQRVHVMYAGEIVETASTDELFARPRMPYTWGLLRSIPRLDRPRARLVPIEGMPPDLSALQGGCRFAPRCAYRRDVCVTERPPLAPAADASGDHLTRCWGAQPGGWLVGVDGAVPPTVAS